MKTARFTAGEHNKDMHNKIFLFPVHYPSKWQTYFFFLTQGQRSLAKIGQRFCSPLTCHPGSGYIGDGLGVWLSSFLRRRRLRVRGAKLRLREPLHHGAVLTVTVPAAALLLAAVLGHHVVVAAVVTEDASTEPEKQKHRAVKT